MIVSELERALLARYPKADAEGWDHVGLSVGDPLLRSAVLPVHSTRPRPTCIALLRPAPTYC